MHWTLIQKNETREYTKRMNREKFTSSTEPKVGVIYTVQHVFEKFVELHAIGFLNKFYSTPNILGVDL